MLFSTLTSIKFFFIFFYFPALTHDTRSSAQEMAATLRLQKELKILLKNPEPGILAKPSSSTNILDWYFLIDGPKETSYENGKYLGKILFPKEYPFKPPGIIMNTPSGRFDPGKKICMSMSDYHPETWNPMWSVSSILKGIQSFMADTEITAGSIRSSENEKKALAKESIGWLVKNPQFRKVFSELVEEMEEKERKMKEEKEGNNE